MTDLEHQPSADSLLRGFAALGTDALHEPPVPATQVSPMTGPATRERVPLGESLPRTIEPDGGDIPVALTALADGNRPAAFDIERYQQVLGDELRKLRRKRGWTRKQLNACLQSEISLQTLATYELGTRHCSVTRLVELCRAMDELPHDLLAKVHQRVFVDEPGQIRANLRVLAGAEDQRLLPLRRWAADRLDQPNAQNEVLLDTTALDRMAELCDLPTTDLIATLRHLEA